MAADQVIPVNKAKTVALFDFNDDGLNDIIIGGKDGLIVQRAQDYLSYKEEQKLESGDTIDLVTYDFDSDGDLDVATINSEGMINFFRNNETEGFKKLEDKMDATYPGSIRILDVTGDGQMDLIVETDGGIEEVLEVRDVFGMQPGGNNGKRAIRFVLSDHLNTAKMLTNNRGLVVWPHHRMEENKLLPFGKDLDFDATNPDPVEASYKLTFTNKEIDHTLDLHYFGARYYSAVDTRFLSPDPIGGTASDPLSWNRYLYCKNDPINYFDPDGEFGICILIVVVAIIVNDMIEPTTVAAPGTEKEAEEYQQNYDHNGILIFASEENPVYDAYSFIKDPGVGTVLTFVPLVGSVSKKISFPGKKRIAKLFNTTVDGFHGDGGIKETIKKQCRKDLKSLKCDNPDIGITSDGFVALKNNLTKEVVVTDIPFSWFVEE